MGNLNQWTTDNYVEVRSTSSKAPPTQETIQDIIRPTTSNILLAESGRPTQTAVTFVSDNKGKSVYSLSVSFQVPDEGSSDTRSKETPPNEDGATRPDIPAVDVLDATAPNGLFSHHTGKCCVVSEARAKLRGMMLGQVTDKDLIHPWALHMAPMPVYMTPHTDQLVLFLNQQALDLQRFCSDTFWSSLTSRTRRLL